MEKFLTIINKENESPYYVSFILDGDIHINEHDESSFRDFMLSQLYLKHINKTNKDNIPLFVEYDLKEHNKMIDFLAKDWLYESVHDKNLANKIISEFGPGALSDTIWEGLIKHPTNDYMNCGIHYYLPSLTIQKNNLEYKIADNIKLEDFLKEHYLFKDYFN